MFSSRIAIKIQECDKNRENIYNNCNTTAASNNKIDRCDSVTALNRTKNQDRLSTTQHIHALNLAAEPSSSISLTSVLNNETVSSAPHNSQSSSSSSSDCSLDLIQLMGVEMPPVRRKGYGTGCSSGYLIHNGPHATVSLPNLYQNVPVHSSTSNTSTPSTSHQLHR